jgi:hypothetical protein
MPDVPSPEDSRPVPPLQPDDSECCRSGCDPCIFDQFAEEMERYRVQLRAWEERQAGKAKEASAD